jgi:hypothetical protein
MATRIFPTANDVGGAGAGRVNSEANMATLIKSILGRNFVVSGLSTPPSSGTLSVFVGFGTALIEGRLVSVDSTTVNLVANATNHVYLQVTRDGSQNVTGAQFAANQTGVDPVDSVKILVAVTNATQTPTITDARTLGYIEYGSNANGEYVKYANGVMEAWWAETGTHTHPTALGAAWYSNDVIWTFPVAFVAAPVVVANATNYALPTVSAGAPSATLRSIALDASTRASTLSAHAIGRWK